MFAGIVASGVGIQSAIEAANAGPLNIVARSVLCGVSVCMRSDLPIGISDFQI
ncbi:MAG: hypothetical protein HC849_21490 [Oscillatoriales cyanobacterium RU_3_3]|nr:hypothetical protein [Oscillatoriales cyanobacterium RU_3_3]NJR25319.1 hypothetical protein [Richelia sp. CSU_2_1]